MTNTQVANLALSHLGVGKAIIALDTENSAEANAIRAFWTPAYEQLLGDYPWPFAGKFGTLTLVEEDPNDEWGYSYRYPGDCLRFRRLLSGLRTDNRQSRIAYREAADDAGTLILTDLEDAECEYTIEPPNPLVVPSDFWIAMSWLLAHYAAPRLTAGDPFKMGQRAYENYLIAASRAYANCKNEEQPDEERDSEFGRTRNGDITGEFDR